MRSLRMLVAMVVVCVFALSTIGYALPPVGQNDWGLKIVIFDVGQADAALLLTPDGEAALIDMGEKKDQGKEIQNYLLNPQENGIAAIDAVKLLFCSHYDGDHIGGASGIDGTIKILAAYDQGPSQKRNPNSTSTLYGKYVRLVGDPNGNGKRDTGESMFVRHKAKLSSKFALGKSKAVKIKVLSVCGDTRGKKYDLPLSPADAVIDENPGSLIQLITLGDFHYLTMGDATSCEWVNNEPDTEAKMLDAGAIPKGVDIDVLKVGHHGSDTSSGLGFVTAVHPKVAVISSGPTKDRLPKLTSIKALEKCGAKVLVTGSARNEQGEFNDSKADFDDGYQPKHLQESVGSITILVSKDGSKYTVTCKNKPGLALTVSAKDKA